jgi:putative intracellular protease/amidase
VRAFVASARPIVAVGHASGALAGVRGSDDHSLIAGRRVTFATRCDDADVHRISPSNDVESAITNAGALVKNEEPGDEHVSVDAYLITAQNLRSAPTATRTIVTFLGPISQP